MLHRNKKWIVSTRICTITVNAGVPQGSTFGLFLLLPYINEITNEITIDIRLYADDTSLFVVVDNNVDQATNSVVTDSDRVNQWSKKWVVDFNQSKTVNVLLGKI